MFNTKAYLEIEECVMQLGDMSRDKRVRVIII